MVSSSVSIGTFLKKPDSYSIMPWQRWESLETRTQGGVSRIQDNVLWVVLLQRGKKNRRDWLHKDVKGWGPAVREHSKRCRSNVRGQIERPVHSSTAFTLAIWKCSREKDIKKKSQEVVMRSSTEGRWMKGAFPWTGISYFDSWYPPVPPRWRPLPQSWRLREVSPMRILSFLAVRADLAWQPDQPGNWILSLLRLSAFLKMWIS